MVGVAQQRTHDRIPSPDGIAAPPGEYESWDAYMLDIELHAAQDAAWRTDADARAIGKAMRLAPNITVFRALLDRQPVPVAALDQQWARRYGLT